jgi:hypothetical protein
MPATSNSQDTGSSNLQQQQQQRQHPLQHVEVPVAAKDIKGDHWMENRLVELLLQRPLMIEAPQQLEEGYVWQDMVMVRGVAGGERGRGRSSAWRLLLRSFCQATLRLAIS